MFLPETLAKQFNIFVTNAVAKFSKLTGEGDRTYFRFIGDSGRRVTNGHGSNCVFVVVNRLNILSTLTIHDRFLIENKLESYMYIDLTESLHFLKYLVTFD